MRKEAAIRIIIGCAKDYQTYLENQNLLFLFGSKEKFDFFESVFLPRHFLHLTGVKIAEDKIFGSSDFYKKALNNELSLEDFSIASDGTTQMKLSILPQLMKLHHSAKMVGDYNFTKSILHTQKLVGNVTATLGFVREGEYYIPNTALKEDMRNISSSTKRILCILSKKTKDEHYNKIRYNAKGIEFESFNFTNNLREKIDKSLFEVDPKELDALFK